jgi:hypothetical protein
MKKPKKKKQNFKQPDELHQALNIPQYEKMQQDDGVEKGKCEVCGKMQKKCKC